MTLNNEENTHPLSSNSKGELASKLMEPTSFDRSSSNSKNMLYSIYSLFYVDVIPTPIA